MCVIALPNDGAEINDDGKSYKIDENSFIIISENEALAYDENGNIHRGYIDNSDITEVQEIPEEKMQDYTICQVTATSKVNVRSSESPNKTSSNSGDSKSSIVSALAICSDQLCFKEFL